MIRIISTHLQAELFSIFFGGSGYPYEVIYVPQTNAFRARYKQQSGIGFQEMNPPFMTFFPLGINNTPTRLNVPAADKGLRHSASLKYKMVPITLTYQAEYYSKDVGDHEAALETFFKWTAPPSELVITDLNGVVFNLPMNVGEATIRPLIEQERIVGTMYQFGFPIEIFGWVVTDGGPINTILSTTVNIYDYTGGVKETSPLIYTKTIEKEE